MYEEGDNVDAGRHVPAVRVSDEDRKRVADLLSNAAAQGLLDLEEFEHRVGLAYAANTSTELARVTADIPAVRPAPPAAPEPSAWARFSALPAMSDPSFRSHFTIYVLTIGMLIGIWLLSGAGHFWPFYPAAGWGIGLGSHFMAATTRAQNPDRDESDHRHRDRDEERALRRAERDRHRHERRHGTPEISTPTEPDQPAARPGRRQFVVAMFADVADSTQLNEVLGDETWVQVRTRFRELVEDCVKGEGGWEVNIAGDGVLSRFDHPAAAVRSAIEIQRRLARRRDETGFSPKVRIGIHSGDVIAEGDDVVGSVVNLASRVTAAAEPGEIMATEHVADHLSGNVHTETRGLRTLKGVAQPRHLVAIRWD